MSGKEIAEKMLLDNNIRDVQVISVPGKLTDHYNPADKTVNLSEEVYMQRNAAAAAVAARPRTSGADTALAVVAMILALAVVGYLAMVALV